MSQKNLPREIWATAYPFSESESWQSVALTVSAASALAVAEAGAGSRVLGLAHIVLRHCAPAAEFARLCRASPAHDNEQCPHCHHSTPTEFMLYSAHRRTATNPRGAYGCLSCTRGPLDPADDLAPWDAPMEPEPPDIKATDPDYQALLLEEAREDADIRAGRISFLPDDARVRRVRTARETLRAKRRVRLSLSMPESARLELAEVNTNLGRALRALIRLHIELSNPPPAIRRLATERQEKTS